MSIYRSCQLRTRDLLICHVDFISDHAFFFQLLIKVLITCVKHIKSMGEIKRKGMVDLLWQLDFQKISIDCVAKW